MTHAHLAQATGWFGKLPGAGDFAQRRLPMGLVDRWDNWLQYGMAQLRHRDADWLRHYLQAPVLHASIGAGLIDAQAWRAVIMPSVDAVGRYFPLTVLAPESAADTPGFAAWRGQTTHCLLQALAEDDDAPAFDRRLQSALAQVPEGDGVEPLVAPARFCRWWADGALSADGSVAATEELPTPDRFAAFYLNPAHT